MKLLFKNAIKNTTTHLVQFLTVVFLLVLAVGLFVTNDQQVNVIGNAYHALKDNVNFRDATTVKRNYDQDPNFSFHYQKESNGDLFLFDKDKKGNQLVDDPNQLFFGIDATGLSDLANPNPTQYSTTLWDTFPAFPYSLMPAPDKKGNNSFSFVRQLGDLNDDQPLAPTFNQAGDEGWLIKSDEVSEFNKLTNYYFDDLSEALQKITLTIGQDYELRALLVRYYYYENPSHIQDLNVNNVSKYDFLNCTTNEAMSPGIDNRAAFSVPLNNASRSILIFKNNKYMDKAYVPGQSNPSLKDNQTFVTSKYISGQNIDPSDQETAKNRIKLSVQSSLYVKNDGYVGDITSPLSSGFFGFDYAANKDTTAIVNPGTFQNLYDEFSTTSTALTFADIKFNNSYNTTDKISDLIKNTINKYYSNFNQNINNNIIIAPSATDESVPLNAAGIPAFKSNVDNSQIFNYSLLSVVLIITALIIIFVLRRRIESTRSEVGILKASGYKTREVAISVAAFGFISSIFGTIFGTCVGWLAGYFVTQTSTQYFLAPFKSFIYTNFDLLFPFFVITFLITLLCYVSGYILLRKPASVLMARGSEFSINSFSKFVQRILEQRSFKTKFRFSLILKSPIKTTVIFVSFLFSSFLLMFSILSSNIFSNVIGNSFDSVKYRYSYNFPASTEKTGLYRIFENKDNSIYAKSKGLDLSKVGNAPTTSATPALAFKNGKIDFASPTGTFANTELAGLLANNGSFFNQDGSSIFNNDGTINPTVDKSNIGITGLFLNANTFNSIFPSSVSTNQRIIAWGQFLYNKLLPWIYGVNPTTPVKPDALPSQASVDALKTALGGPTSANQFLGSRQLKFTTLANINYSKMSDIYFKKLSQLIVQGIGLNKDDTVNVGFSTYNPKDEFPYKEYKISPLDTLPNDQSARNAKIIAYNEVDNKNIQDYDSSLRQSDLNKLNFNSSTGVMDVYANKTAMSTFHLHVGEIVNDSKETYKMPNSTQKFTLKLRIVKETSGYFQSLFYTNSNALTSFWKLKPTSNDNNVKIGNIFNNFPGGAINYYNAIYSKESDNKLTTHTPVYTGSENDTILQYQIMIAGLIDVPQTKSLLEKAQVLFSAFISFIIAFTCIISLLVIIALTNIIINENKKAIAIMKLLGYQDIEINWLLISVFLILIILAILLSFGLVYLFYWWLTNFLYNTININILVQYPAWVFIVNTVVILALFAIAYLTSWKAVKKIGLIKTISQAEN